MNHSEINLNITLDENNVCEKIIWDATQKPTPGTQEAKAVALALWEGIEKGTLKIDLWTKEMQVYEMKRFFIEIMATMADTIRTATSDEIMAVDIENFCDKLAKRLETELKNT